MLSYQHMYHAGCMSDIQKHVALAILLTKMLEKDKPITYMETHAGRGLYDLSSIESIKTGEATNGIIRLLNNAKNKTNINTLYLNTIDIIHKKYGSSFYPGSPMIAKTILRDCDRMLLAELHPREYEALSQNMDNKNTTIVKQDGYKAIMAASPPIIRRGLVLIDPSYEIKDEYEQVTDFIIKLHKKWSVAVIMLWYPILTENRHKNMISNLLAKNFPKLWHQEILFKKEFVSKAIGSGLLCINTPFGTEEGLNKISSYF